MIVRGKSASGMVRWNIDSVDEPLLVLAKHARKSWPEHDVICITRGSSKADNLLTCSLGSETFASAGINNGDVFFVEFAKEATMALQASPHVESSVSPTISTYDARCFNYKIFAYLRKYSSWFQPSEGLPSQPRQLEQNQTAT